MPQNRWPIQAGVGRQTLLCPDLSEPAGCSPWAQAELAPVSLHTLPESNSLETGPEFKQAFSVKQLPRAVPWLGEGDSHLLVCHDHGFP